MLEAAFRRVPRQRMYAITGLQFLQFNTVYQLLAMSLGESPLLEVGRDAPDDAPTCSPGC